MTRTTTARGTQRRGDELRRHVLLVAKDVFLESGYERASMDAVAARAGTSKRSLYAHFENKEALYRAVHDLVRTLYLDQLRTPETYAAEPREAVTRYCGRFLQLMVWESQVRFGRLSIAEAERLPDSATAYFDAVFATPQQRLSTYLAAQFPLRPAAATALAQELIGRLVLPRVLRTLLGVDPALPGHQPPPEGELARQVDLRAIRRAVTAALPG